MTCYRLLLAYEGSSFSGWQVQPHSRTVQGTVEEALTNPLRGRYPIIGSSRTDTGVHALGQVAHFHIDRDLDPDKLCRSLNGLLPPTIRCYGVAQAEDRFHSQLWAKRKSYLYRIQLGKWQNPLLRLTSTHWPHPFDHKIFEEISLCFLGTHDFSALANENHKGSASKNAVRTIDRISIQQRDSMIEVEFVGNGFLYKQVRNMMGCMLAGALGRANPEQVQQWMAKKDRRLLPPPAPAEGLCLQWIDYGCPLIWHGEQGPSLHSLASPCC